MLDKLWRQEETFAGFSNWSFCGISTLIVPSIGFTCTHHHMSVTPHSIGHHCDYLANGFETLLLFSWIERPHLRVSLIMVIWWWLCGVYGWQKKDNSPWRPPSHSPLPDSPPSLILVATHCPIRSSLINLESHFENEIELAKAWPIKKSHLSLKLKSRFLCSCLATTWMSHLNSLPVLLLLCTYLGSRGWMSDLHSPQADPRWLPLCSAVPAGRYSSDNSCFHSRLPPRLLLLLILLRHKPFLSTTALPLLPTSLPLPGVWWYKVSDVPTDNVLNEKYD